MRTRLKAYILALAALLWCALVPALAQLGTVGVGGGGFGGGAAAYTGPIDINGAAYAFWSTRCGAAAYSGNIVEVWDSATGSTTQTILGCDGAGNIVVKSGSALATTCASGCRVKTLYDQSGSSKCSGACDMAQATNANRPTFNTSLLSGKSGMVFSGTQCLQAPAISSAQAQPYTMSAVYNPTGLSGVGDLVGDTAGGSIEFFHNGGASQAGI